MKLASSAKIDVLGDRAVAQFDVYRNPSRSRSEFPWVVDIQSDLLASLTTRLVMPLALRKHVPGASPRSLCPHVQFEGDALVALPHFAAPLRFKELGVARGSLRSQASELVGAFDAVISGV